MTRYLCNYTWILTRFASRTYPKLVNYIVDAHNCLHQVVLSVAGGGRQVLEKFPRFRTNNVVFRANNGSSDGYQTIHCFIVSHSCVWENPTLTVLSFDLEIKLIICLAFQLFLILLCFIIMIIITFTFWTAWSFLRCRWWLLQTWCF